METGHGETLFPTMKHTPPACEPRPLAAIAAQLVVFLVVILPCRSLSQLPAQKSKGSLQTQLQGAVDKATELQMLPPLPYIVTSAETVPSGDIRTAFPSRSDAVSPSSDGAIPNRVGFPNYSPDLPLSGGAEATRGGTAGASLLAVHAPTIPPAASPPSDGTQHVQQPFTYVPETARAVGAAGGGDSNSVVASQLTSKYYGVPVAGVPKLDIPGAPAEFTDRLPPGTLPPAPVSQMAVPIANANVPQLPVQGVPAAAARTAQAAPVAAISGIQLPNLADAKVHVPTALPMPPTAGFPGTAQLSPAVPTMPDIGNVPLPNAPVPAVNVNLSPPPQLLAVLGLVAGLTGPLSIVGFKLSRDCTKEETLMGVKECALHSTTEVATAFDSMYEAAMANSRVLAGGRTAEKALARMRDIYSSPFGPESLSLTGTPLTCLILASKEATPDALRWQALSMVTLLTNLPAGVTIDDTPSGGFGHLNLVMPSPTRIYQPDRDIPLLDAGVSPEALIDGSLYGIEGSDTWTLGP